MERIVLTMKENIKYTKIKNFVDNSNSKSKESLKIAKHRLCIDLGCSLRTVNRLIKNYREKGKASFRHGNHDHKPVSTIDECISSKILNLYKSTYSGFNFSHFREFLLHEHGIKISYSALYRLLTNNGYLSKKARRKTKREYYKKSLPKLDNDEIENVIIKSNEIDNSLAHPRQERAKYFGEVIEMDASQHLWFGDKKVHLHLAIDNCTSTIVAAFFDVQETLFGYYTILKQIIENYGIPYSILTDRRTVFVYQSLKKKTLDKDTFTQFSFASKLLGIELNTTSIPQAKGKVERSFNTHQDRLIAELELKNITTIEEANKYLCDYVTKHNNKYALPYQNSISVFEKQYDKSKLDLILSKRVTRSVDKGNSIKYLNNYYLPLDEEGKYVTLSPKSTGVVISAFNKDLYYECGDKVYKLNLINKHKSISENIDVEKKVRNKNKYISKPSLNHPWRNSDIVKHQHLVHDKIKTLEEYFEDCVPL